MRAASFMLFHSIEKFQGKLRDAEELGPQASAKNGTSCSRPAKPACSRRLGGGVVHLRVLTPTREFPTGQEGAVSEWR